MKLQTYYRGVEFAIVPPVLVVNSVPVAAYRLLPQEIEEIVEFAYHKASLEPLKEIFRKSVNALKRLQGEFEFLGHFELLEPRIEVKIGRNLYFLSQEGVFRSKKGLIKALSVPELLNRLKS